MVHRQGLNDKENEPVVASPDPGAECVDVAACFDLVLFDDASEWHHRADDRYDDPVESCDGSFGTSSPRRVPPNADDRSAVADDRGRA